MGEVATANTTVNPMTPEEIEAAGIDVNDPDNQYVYEFETTLVFGEMEMPMPKAIVSGNGKVHKGGSAIHFDGGSGGIAGGSGESSSRKGVIIPQFVADKEHPEIPPTLLYLVIPSTVSWLKEFFDVYMVIDNQALPQFDTNSP